MDKYTNKQREEAIKQCRENGEDPFDWLNYFDLCNNKQRWEYFLETDNG